MSKAETSAAVKAGFIGLAAVLIVFYILVASFYTGHFTANLFVNGILLTGQDIAGANSLLQADTDKEFTFVITKDGRQIGKLTEKELESDYDYTGSLNDLKKSESSFMWIPYLTGVRSFDMVPSLSFDRNIAKQAVLELPFVKEVPDSPDPVFDIKKDGSGVYVLEDNTQELKDKEKLVNSILDALESGKIGIDIDDIDYSYKYTYSEDQLEDKELFEYVDKYQSSKITLADNGLTYVIDGDDIAELFVTDQNGNFMKDVDGKPLLATKRIDGFVKEISELFNTKGQKIQWEKYNGGTVSLNSGQYGREVDEKKTADIIEKAVVTGEKTRTSPAFTGETERNGIGNTYVEVDMTKQHLYFVKDGRLCMHTDVVTGNINRKNGTPETIEPIYFMQKNRVLVGPNYRTPVKFWMAFHNHVGLHDANWRSKFGGEIYKSNGSHGCVNLPPDFAEKLYAQAYVGLPVITYY